MEYYSANYCQSTFQWKIIGKHWVMYKDKIAFIS